MGKGGKLEPNPRATHYRMAFHTHTLATSCSIADARTSHIYTMRIQNCHVEVELHTTREDTTREEEKSEFAVLARLDVFQVKVIVIFGIRFSLCRTHTHTHSLCAVYRRTTVLAYPILELKVQPRPHCEQ